MYSEFFENSSNAGRPEWQAIRAALAPEYAAYSDSELEALFQEALEGVPQEEAEEILGLIASAGAALVPSLVKGGAKLIGRGVKAFFKKKSRKGIRRSSPNQAIASLLAMLQDPRVLSTISGFLLNNRTGRKIGRTKTRIVVRRKGQREINDISAEALLNTIGYLAQTATGNSERIAGPQINSYLTNESGQFMCNPINAAERAEVLLEKLYGNSQEEETIWVDDSQNGESFGQEAGTYLSY